MSRIIAIVLIVLGATGIIATIYTEVVPWNALGWDAPYYIARTRLVIDPTGTALDIGGGRIAYHGLSAFVSSLTGSSPLVTERWLPIALVGLAAGLVGWLIRRWTDKERVHPWIWPFAAVAAVSTFHLHRLAQSLSDNLLGLVLLLAWLAVLEDLRGRDWPRIFIGSTLLLSLAFTHLEFFLIAMLISAATMTLRMITKTGRSENAWSWLAVAIGALAGYYNWGTSAVSLVHSYTGQPPLTSETVSQMSNGVQDVLFGWYNAITLGANSMSWMLVGFVAVAIFWTTSHWRTKHFTISQLAFIVWTVGVLLLPLTRHFGFIDIPNDRIALIFPMPLWLSLGLVVVIKNIQQWTRNGAAFFGTICLSAMLLVIPVSYATNLQPYFAERGIEELQEASEQLIDTGDSSAIVVSELIPHESNPMAYYYMHQNWVKALLPLAVLPETCLYVPTLNDLPTNQQAGYKGAGYNQARQDSQDCLTELDRNDETPVIISEYLAPQLYRALTADLPSGGVLILRRPSDWPKSLQGPVQ